MWNYVNFYAYLKYKDPTEFTGIESFLWKQINTNDVTWFPFRKALCLKGIEDEEDQQKQTIKEVQSKVMKFIFITQLIDF